MPKPHWIANNICSNCWKGIKGYAIQQGYIFCPFCGERLEHKKEPAKAVNFNKNTTVNEKER